MKQLTKQYVQAFIQGNRIACLPTQKKLCLPILNRLYIKMTLGIHFPCIQIHDELICDGHHRYLAALISGYPIETCLGVITSATHKYAWLDIEFDEGDWDTPIKINRLLEQDAAYNHMSIEHLRALIK